MKGEKMDPQIQSVNELSGKSVRNPELAAKIRENPAETIGRLPAGITTDVWLYRIVVGTLGGAVLLTVIGSMLLAYGDMGMGPGMKEIPGSVIAIGSSAAGALAGLLTPFPTR
jgi:hypothetical protein